MFNSAVSTQFLSFTFHLQGCFFLLSTKKKKKKEEKRKQDSHTVDTVDPPCVRIPYL